MDSAHSDAVTPCMSKAAWPCRASRPPFWPTVARSACPGSGGGSGDRSGRAAHWSLEKGRWKADEPDNLCSAKAEGNEAAATPSPAARSAKPSSGGVNGAHADLPDSGNCRDVLWKTHEVSLLAKIPNARLVKDFRPIAVLPVSYKLYSRVMYMLAENTCDRFYAPQFAFRKYHQAHEVVFIMRQLIEKAVEWKAPEVYIMDGDIKKAYDYASHALFAEAARSRGMHEVLIHAWLREWRNMKSEYKLDLQTTSKEVEWTRSFPQGDPAAPMIFNLALDTIAETFIKTARQKGWGKELQDGSWVNLILLHLIPN